MRKGWEKCNLEDYIKLIDYRGRTPVKTESGIRLITAKNVKLGYLQLEPQEFINPDNYETWMTRGIPNFGDVIFTTEAPLANVAQLDTTEKVAFAQRIIVMQPRPDKIDQTFLKYMLLSNQIRSEILGKGTGATVQGIKSSLLKKVKIYFPPLSEQQRIVSILDEAFSSIEQAKENLQRNLQNAKELFQSELNSIFTNKGEGWEGKTLEEVCETISDGDHQPPPKTEEGVPFITISNINKDTNRIDFSHTYNVSTEYFEKIKPNRKAQEGDVLYTVTGSYGIPVLIDFEKDFCFQRHIGLIRPSNKLDKQFLFYWILSPNCFRQAHDSATGTAQKTVSLNSLRNFKISVPNLETQQKIVQQLDKLSTETKRLEAMYQQKLDALEELKKSILQKAFLGELNSPERA